jgi:hypothetical protein
LTDRERASYNRPVAQEPSAESSGELVFRRGKLRKRDDPAIDLFREALGHLDDVPRVRRICLELGRLYDPIRDAPILEPSACRAVLALLEAGRAAEARPLLEEALARYTRLDRPASGAAGPAGETP